MDVKAYTSANREAWNQVMPLHQQKTKDYLDSFFSTPGAVIQSDPDLLKIIEQIDITQKSIIHLCCNNGVELLSLKNMGAGQCIGVDISDAAIHEAEERKKKYKIDCNFLCADVFEIPSIVESEFDIVMLTAGCLGWMPDIELFFSICSKLLKKNGMILIHEIHPFSEMLAFDYSDVDDRTKIIEPYFRDKPIIEKQGLDYIGKQNYEAKETYWFVHTVGSIINALYSNGIIINKFVESIRDISAGHKKIEKLNAGIPLSMIILGKKI